MKELVFIISISLLTVSCASVEDSTVEKTSVQDNSVEDFPNDTPGLINGLAFAEGPASDQYFASLSHEEQAVIRKRAYRIVDELESRGLQAFPMLLNSMNDDRQSIDFSLIVARIARPDNPPATVGDVCFQIIARQLHSLPKGYRDQKKFYRRPAPKAIFNRASVENWLDTRKSKSLAELQIEVLTSKLEQERKIGTESEDDYRDFIRPLELHLKALTEKAEQDGADRPSTAAEPKSR